MFIARLHISSLVVAGAAMLTAWGEAIGAASPSTSPTVDFSRQIRPILSENCYKCHGPDDGARKSKLRLDVREQALKPAKSGRVAIVPGKPAESELLSRVTAPDPDDRMPPARTGKRLSAAQIELLRRWIQEGARYAVHWAYIKPVRPALPSVKNPRWARNPLDVFILARLEKEKLRPSPEADRYTLIRRVSLDLTGLPPTPAQVDAFQHDKSREAYEKVVQNLLDSPAYGEHWARLWLDLARYADSAGYADDPLRTIWTYRDYVIKSFNANKPFDRFTLEQIAGDLLDSPDDECLVATAFHRNTMTNNEGGTSDEEFRNAAVVDRVNTTMAAWMGTSMACAQCHHHKYDPISQQEYFQMFAIFNNTEDADRQDEAPVLELPTPAEKEKRAKLQLEISELKTKLGPLADQTVTNQTNLASADKAELEKLASLKKKLEAIQPNSVPIMRELTGEKRRVTHVQIRGNYQALAEEVSEGLPAAFHPLPSNVKPDRRALALWLTSPDNPLTARVVANRLWEQMFGIGIVRTSDDFGSQGDLPSHPELLDWLATEMVAQHWDLKAFLKTLVTSATYRQSSRVIPALLEKDPENLLLARGPRFRMPAEVVRDQALAVSGLLSRKMYGPPVRPPRPSFGLTAAFGSSLDWKNSDGEDTYRRAVYIELRRTSPYPSLATFDAPNREVCALKRPRSNTPLQALVTMNDPVFFEAAQALAVRILSSEGALEQKLDYGFRLCLARPPEKEEVLRLVKLYQDAETAVVNDPSRSAALINLNAKNPQANNLAELAAWTVVANVLLNLDEMFMRP